MLKPFIQRSLVLAALCCSPLTFALSDNSSANTIDPKGAQLTLDAEWRAYIARSQELRKQDNALVRAEMRRKGLKKPLLPRYAKEFGFDPEQPAQWFTSPEGKNILAAILSLQTPSGGWSKRTDMTQKRKPGMAFGIEKNYIPTFDNDATSMQIALLAKAYSITGDSRYQEAFERGLRLILNAQYPNGGWPQNFPLVGGYHNHITYNDSLMVNLMFLLRDIATGTGNYSFTTQAQRQAAQSSLDKAIQCVLNTQVLVGDKLTVWGAQHDPISLMPAQARAYEMSSLTSSESVWMVEFFMGLDNPSPAVIESVHAAAAWYEASKILGKSWQRGASNLTDDPNAAPLWSRFYELSTNQPIFGDRDGSIHYEIGKVSQERREGYAWFTTAPNKMLKNYARWAKQHPR